MALSLRYGHGDLHWFDKLERADRALIVAWDIEMREANRRE